MIVIGIVGPPAGGKSTVAKQLMGLGAAWIDADAIAHQVLQQPEVQRHLVAHFGPRVMAGQDVDRKWLAGQVFGADPTSLEQLRWLEATIHPPTLLLLQKQLIEAADRRAPAALLDVPLLFESGCDLLCDFIWCLDTPLEKRRQWVQKRGWSAEELQKREQRQLPLVEKKRRSTHVIANDGDVGTLAETVQRLWTEVTRPANRPQSLQSDSPQRETSERPRVSGGDPHCNGPLPSA
ncbi:dephospho-CoA kinase [Roseimaritima ulvae]|uniref:Dephospho-CoA kinase n=1 Tax=Roseimaritima ulvae TaxID=980254 RepID=A0A5B9QKK3_9BACT|nr:dephospho-CoA kinase [Roseimaritima ulvae]QEG39598.1 Dephospho-CoA kinase [Roseimaritima ulvae]